MTCELLNVAVARTALGEVIRNLRKAQHVSQGKLAREAGIDRQTIANIEMGRTKALRGDGFRAVAKALGKTPEQLDALIIEAKGPVMPGDMWERLIAAADAIGENPVDLFVGFLTRIERKAQPKRMRKGHTKPKIVFE